MKKKIISLVLVIALVFSFAATALAAAPSTMPEDRQAEVKAELREIVAASVNGVANLGSGLLENTTVLDFVKSAVKSMVSGLLDLGNLSDTAGSALGGLIGGALSGLIGIDLPAGIDLGGIIDSIIGNEIISGIITSDFVATVIDKTIDNVFASLDMTLVVDLVVDVLIDKYTDQIWNNGNPRTGTWNNSSESWNTLGIIVWLGINALGDVGGLAMGGDIGDLVDEDAFDLSKLLSIFDLNVLLSAVVDAVVDTATEYFNAFKDQLIAQVKGAIDDIVYQAKAKLAAEINGFFCAAVVTADMSFEAMACAIEAAICGLKVDAAQALIEKLIAMKKQVHSCIHNFIDRLIEKCCKCCDPGDVEVVGKVNMLKLVNDEGENVYFIDWLIDNGYFDDAFDIINDITFELYVSDADGTNGGALAAAGAVGIDNMITFEPDVAPGWYLVHEVLGPIASKIFKDTDDVLIYFTGKIASTGAGQASNVIAAGETFTITQYFGSDVSRPVEVLYTNDDGTTISYYLRSTPWLDIEGAPSGGGALATSKFTAEAGNGDVYTSFCADIGAVGVKGTYILDESNHGFSDEQMYSLVAALDYIYGLDASFFNAEYERIALAQLIVWNLILQYTDDMLIADYWLKSAGVLYTELYGKIYRILGYNNTNGSNPWYTDSYKALIIDVITNIGKYVDIYDGKLATLTSGKFVSSAAFLKGDKTAKKVYADMYQQRQLIILFDEPVPFVNEPDDGELIGKLNLDKMVLDDNTLALIVDWLIDNGYIDDAFDILADITFELYRSDAAGTKGAYVTSGYVDINSTITFDEDIPTGWYLVHEVLGPLASTIFQDVDDLLIYFNAETEKVTGNSNDFDYDALYTIVNGYGGGYVLGYPGLNNSGDVFYIGVTNADSGVEYASFCANAGSTNFAGDNGLGCTGYMVAQKAEAQADYLDFLAAYNYIEDKIGGLDANRAITQIVTWVLLGAIDVESAAFDAINWDTVNNFGKFYEGADAKADVLDVLANYSGYVGEGKIVDLVYMVCEDPDHGVITCQPQLVPIYEGEVTFNNEPNVVVVGFGAIEVIAEVKEYKDDYVWIPGSKTVGGTLVTYVGSPRNTDKKDNGGYNEFGDYIDNAQGGFTAVAIAVNTAEANDRVFDIAKSGHGNPKFQENKDKIGLTYTVEVVDGNIVITFDDNFISTSIAVGVYNSISELSAIKWAPGQYNITRGHVYNTTGVFVAPLPANAGETVYLALHLDGATFKDGSGKWQYNGQIEVPYAGDAWLTVFDAELNPVHGPVNYTDFLDGTLYAIFDQFEEGFYTCVLTGSGFASQTVIVEVIEDQTATADFGLIEINKAP